MAAAFAAGLCAMLIAACRVLVGVTPETAESANRLEQFWELAEAELIQAAKELARESLRSCRGRHPGRLRFAAPCPAATLTRLVLFAKAATSASVLCRFAPSEPTFCGPVVKAPSTEAAATVVTSSMLIKVAGERAEQGPSAAIIPMAVLMPAPALPPSVANDVDLVPRSGSRNPPVIEKLPSASDATGTVSMDREAEARPDLPADVESDLRSRYGLLAAMHGTGDDMGTGRYGRDCRRGPEAPVPQPEDAKRLREAKARARGPMGREGAERNGFGMTKKCIRGLANLARVARSTLGCEVRCRAEEKRGLPRMCAGSTKGENADAG